MANRTRWVAAPRRTRGARAPPCTAPNDGAVTVTNTAGCDPTVSGIAWRPPHTPAVTNCQVSAAYRSEHDGHTLARRFLHRANTVCSRPAPSAPTRCTGRAQNPHPLTFNHQPSNPGDAARATSCPTARAGSAIPDEVTGHGSTAVDHSPATPAFIPTHANHRV